MNVFFDGSLRGGVLRTCVFADGFEPLVATWPDASRMTSGHAEWLAAREAARFATVQSVRRIDLVGDCQNVIRHMDPDRVDAAKCSVEENVALAREIDLIVGGLRARGTEVVWRHVVRGGNPAGVHLDATWCVRPG